MQQVYSELKLVDLNTEELNTLPVSIEDEIGGVRLDGAQMDEMQIDEDANTIKLDNNEIIISELLSLYEDSIQKGIYIDNCIQLIKQHILFKSKNEDEIFNYLLGNKDKQQNII